MTYHKATKASRRSKRRAARWERELLEEICDILKCPHDAEALLQSVKAVAALEKDKERKTDALQRVLSSHTQAEKDDAIHYVRAALAPTKTEG